MQGSEITTLSVGIGATIWFAVFPPRTILMRLILGIFAIAFLIYGLTTITLEYVAMKIPLWPIVIIGGVVGCIAAGLAWEQSIKHPAQAERPKPPDEVTTRPEIPAPKETQQSKKTPQKPLPQEKLPAEVKPPPTIVVQLPPVGNLKQRAITLSGEIMEDLYLHGWPKRSWAQPQNMPPQVIIERMPTT